jgi:hypothetical protein
MAAKKNTKTKATGSDLPKTVYVQWSDTDPEQRFLSADDDAIGAAHTSADGADKPGVIGEYQLVRKFRAKIEETVKITDIA